MSADRNGIQAGRSVPPWEQPGCFRMDCEPHRADLLRVLGITSVAAALGSVVLFPVASVGIPLCLVTWLTARSDLAKMRRGLMDREGEDRTDAARSDGLGGLVLYLLVAVGWGWIFLLVALMRV